MWLPGSHKVNALMGNTADETESMHWADEGGTSLHCTNFNGGPDL
jgi:hypothetical protein